MAPKKGKGKEKVFNPSKELLVHADLHSFKKFNDENDLLIAPFKGPLKGKRAKTLKHPKMDKISRAQEKEVDQNVGQIAQRFFRFTQLFQDPYGAMQ